MSRSKLPFLVLNGSQLDGWSDLKTKLEQLDWLEMVEMNGVTFNDVGYLLIKYHPSWLFCNGFQITGNQCRAMARHYVKHLFLAKEWATPKSANQAAGNFIEFDVVNPGDFLEVIISQRPSNRSIQAMAIESGHWSPPKKAV
jgi:hypothetical protein